MECLLSIFADNFFQKTKWIRQKLKLETCVITVSKKPTKQFPILGSKECS